MERNTAGLSKHLKQKTEKTQEKVDIAIREMIMEDKDINFNSVSAASGVSKTYLYSNEEIRKRIEVLREKTVNKKINQRAKYDKTAKSKDIVIESKDKKIAELKSENQKMKTEIETLRRKIYELM